MKKSYKVVLIAVLFVGLAFWNYRYKTSIDGYFENFNAQTSQIKDIKDEILNLNYAIQESVLFQFYNNDKVNSLHAAIVEKTQNLAQNLEGYEATKSELQTLQTMMDKKYETIKKLYISNAKIKNSITYLSSQLHKLEGFDKEYTHLVVHLVNYFFQVKNTLDYSYATNNELFQNVMDYHFKDTQKQRFHDMLKIHTDLLLHEFPYYIFDIENATTLDEVEQTQKMLQTYIQESQTIRQKFDVQILFIVFASMVALVVILYLLLHSEKEKTKIIRLQEEFKKSINTDILTALPNRTAYYSNTHHRRDSYHLLLIDLIEFRNINSIFGMQVGDYLLIELARLLQQFTQNESDSLLYRIGPDEFAIVYEKKEDGYVLKKAQAILHLIENSEIYYDEIKIPVTVNIGIANTSPHLLNAQRCIRELHHTFGEKIKVYNESMNDIEQIKSNIETVQRVKEAMSQDKIIPYFQPIVDAKSGAIKKYETLMRIEQGGEVLPPYLFLDITKKVKLYNAISHRIIEKSIETIKQKGVEIAINISIEDILESKNSRFIYDLLKTNEAVAQKITFEIVESEQIRDYGRLMEFIEIVKSYGCKIAIDDFGSGYSNFDYLFNFDVDFLKIDGSLIKNIDTDERSFMIVKTIVAFAKEAQIETVAEFVHSQEVAAIVKEIGIDYAQGYFYGKPTKI